MKKGYALFLRRGIDLKSLGIEQDRENSAYFCTPKGASIIGWAGVDGVHYCFVRGFGEMVFAVSPMSIPGHYVHPLAKNFPDFLRLLLSCGSADALEQLWAWDEEQFRSYLRDNPATQEGQETLKQIEEMGLQVMEDPFSYVKKLQQEFDYKKIPFSREYEETIPGPPQTPPWKVYFDGGFWTRKSRERPGQELLLNKSFDWEGQRGMIPSLYLCGKGLVIDFCLRVPLEEIRTHREKWDGGELDRDRALSRAAEDPLNVQLRIGSLLLNGRPLRWTHGSGVVWDPCRLEGEYGDLEARSALEHYALDPAWGWSIRRVCFPWATKRKPRLKTLSLVLEQEPIEFPGPYFRPSARGEQLRFRHPLTGEEHILTVEDYQSRELAELEEGLAATPLAGYELPRHCVTMTCSLTPELPENTFFIRDSSPGDQPRIKGELPTRKNIHAGAIGVIGGADGPTAIFISRKSRPFPGYTVTSSAYFQPPKEVEWRLIFREKTRGSLSLELIREEKANR